MEHLIKKLQTENLVKYQSLPFWSWNAELEIDELKKQIRWMKDNGIGGFFMHARSGLITEYLSEDWMQCIEACVEEGEKLGMEPWLYDENGWPSGFAGGKLLEDPENCDKYILTQTGELDPAADVSYLMDGEKLVRTTAPGQGEYLNLYIHTANSTADILNPDVVQKFINLTHEEYKKRFGADFAKKIRGFFTDEPQYQRWHTPYTVMMEKYFRETYHEDILDGLGLLFVEKDGYRQFRYRYWSAMQELMLNNFGKKIYDWCEENGIMLTGHYIEENSMGGQMLCCAGIMPFYEYEHIPGIDWLGKGSNNELGPRQVGSAAQQMGKKLVLTESYGCCGWEVSPTDLRRITGFQYVNGANLLCQHLLPYAEYGNRKHDHPAHYSNINPWVREEFKNFNDYFTRLGYLLANGEESVNVAMLHPIRSSYFDYKRELEGSGFGIRELDRNLHKACRTLSGASIAYHFLDETLLKRHGFVKGAKIGCGLCAYDYLVLPQMYTMDRSTEKLLKEYVANGGKVLLLDEKPTYLEAEPYDYTYLSSNCTLADLIAAQPFRVENLQTELYTTYRKADGTDFLFVQNGSATEGYTQTFRFPAQIKSFLKLDLSTYKAERVPLTVEIKPAESVLLFPDTQEAPSIAPLTQVALQFTDAKVAFEENHLPVDFIRYSTDGVQFSQPIPSPALFQYLLEQRYEGRIFFKYEFEITEVPSKILLRAEECHEISATLNGIPLTEKLPSGIEKNVIAYDIAPMVKTGINDYTVETNWYQSEDVYYALFGENVTESLKNIIVYHSTVEPVYIAGEFGVYPKTGYTPDADPAYVTAEGFYIGSVPETVADPITGGFPCIAAPITLSQEVELPAQNVLLKIEGNYHVADVTVNGQAAGKLLFDKELDISAYAKPGKNEIQVRFLLNVRNLLGPQHYAGNKNAGISPFSFQLSGTWKDLKSPLFHEHYDLLTLYARVD